MCAKPYTTLMASTFDQDYTPDLYCSVQNRAYLCKLYLADIDYTCTLDPFPSAWNT